MNGLINMPCTVSRHLESWPVSLSVDTPIPQTGVKKIFNTALFGALSSKISRKSKLNIVHSFAHCKVFGEFSGVFFTIINII